MSSVIDPRRTLIVKTPTLRVNPAFDSGAVDIERTRDAVSAAAEYDVIARSDSTACYPEEWIEEAVDAGVFEREPIFKWPDGTDVQRFAWTDTSGGGPCAMVLAIARKEGDRGVLECVRTAPRSQSRGDAVAAFAAEVKRYGLSVLYRDAYGGDWPSALFAASGVTCMFGDKARSNDIEGQGARSKADTSYVFLEAVPLFSTGKLTLLDHPQLKQELIALERKTGAFGKDRAGKPATGFDDHAAAVVGALWMCARRYNAQSVAGGLVAGDSIYQRTALELSGVNVASEKYASIFDRYEDIARSPINDPTLWNN